MAKIGLPKGSGKRLKVREKSVKSQGILKWRLSGNPETLTHTLVLISISRLTFALITAKFEIILKSRCKWQCMYSTNM